MNDFKFGGVYMFPGRDPLIFFRKGGVTWVMWPPNYALGGNMLSHWGLVLCFGTLWFIMLLYVNC